MKNIFKFLFTSISITIVLFVGGLLLTLVPTFVLLILKFVLGYSWNVVFIPTYIVMVVVSIIGVMAMFSPKLRERIREKRKI